MLASPQAMSRNENDDGKTSFRVCLQDAADLALRQAIAFDQLAIGRPLLLELLERRGVHHRAARLELMDMNVDQVRCLLFKASALSRRDRDR